MLKKKYKKLKLTNFLKVIGLDITGEIYIRDGKLIEKDKINKNIEFETLDASNCIVSPGFIDVQINGYKKISFWDLEPTENTFLEIGKLRLELALCGIVAFCPTIITAPKEKIIKSIDCINSYLRQSSNDAGARILGIHVEGIFITKYGVHESKYANSDLTVNNVISFIKENVILFTLAPELDKTGKAIRFLQKNNILVSIGHSNGSYRDGEIAIKQYDLKTVTHMFNALRGINDFNHRSSEAKNIELLRSKTEDDRKINPDKDGIMLALLKSKDVLCMVISDGIHVSKEVVCFLMKYKGKENVSLASDLVSSNVYNSSKAKGILGGGQITLNKCISNLIDWKVSNLEDCLSLASTPISRYLKVASNINLGKIHFGQEANLVLWDAKKNIVKGTIIGENVFLNY